MQQKFLQRKRQKIQCVENNEKLKEEQISLQSLLPSIDNNEITTNVQILLMSLSKNTSCVCMILYFFVFLYFKR